MDVSNLVPLAKEVSLKEHIIAPEVEYVYTNEKGDGYLGVIKAIRLNGRNKSLEVIVKFAADSDVLRVQAPIREAFLTEIWFYEKIVPSQLSIQAEHNVKDPFVNYPKCYATSRKLKNETLFLEDLKQHGYQMWNRKVPMNHEHLKFIFSEYGRFHGTNFAIKILSPGVFKEITAQLVDIPGLFNKTEGFTATLKNVVSNVQNILHPVKDKKYYDIMSVFNVGPTEKLATTSELDEFCVILHGDCWCNNMMFKYENPDDTSKPDSIKLIDFQWCKEGSPVLDLSYFFYVCADKPSFARLDEYLHIYHESLTTHLAEFGLDSKNVYPFSKLKEHWKRYGMFGYFLALFLVKIMLSDADELPDLAEEAKSAKTAESNLMSKFDFESRKEEQYKERIRELIYHLVDCGYIS